jgi:hypothetical protein
MVLHPSQNVVEHLYGLYMYAEMVYTQDEPASA